MNIIQEMKEKLLFSATYEAVICWKISFSEQSRDVSFLSIKQELAGFCFLKNKTNEEQKISISGVLIKPSRGNPINNFNVTTQTNFSTFFSVYSSVIKHLAVWMINSVKNSLWMNLNLMKIKERKRRSL